MEARCEGLLHDLAKCYAYCFTVIPNGEKNNMVGPKRRESSRDMDQIKTSLQRCAHRSSYTGRDDYDNWRICKALKKGARVYWQGDATDSGIITETSWDAVTIAWNNGQVARVHHGDMREIQQEFRKSQTV